MLAQRGVTRLVHRRHARAVVLAREALDVRLHGDGPHGRAEVEDVLARACVKIKLRAPHAVDATLSP